MQILATFPGKHGDLLWALPTVRAISESYDVPVDLQISGAVASLAELIERQPYIGHVAVDRTWMIRDTAPVTPREPPHGSPSGYDRVFHLGYAGWPTPDLPRDIYRNALLAYEDPEGLQPLDLDRPWIVAPYTSPPTDLVVGFTDEHFELKYGIYWLLRNRYRRVGRGIVTLGRGIRWATEAMIDGYDWGGSASWLATARVYVGCCSAQHVLACAVGTPAVVLLEPNAARWNDIFYPYGKAGAKVWLTIGGDQQPTFDVRHLCELIDRQFWHQSALREPIEE